MICANCQQPNTNPMLCGACREVSYCNRECQVADWKSHKQACKKKPIQTTPIANETLDKEIETINKSIEQKLEKLKSELPKEEDEDESLKRTKAEAYEYFLQQLEKAELENPEIAKKTASFNRIKDFETTHQLGTGNFTTIFQVKEMSTGKEFALKVAEKNKLKRMHKEKDLIVEKHCLNKLKGVHSVVQIEETFQDSENLYILMELIKGKEFFDAVVMFGIVDKKAAYTYLRQILVIVKDIHEKGIVHRDLKPENIMLSPDQSKLTLIDFGSAKDIVEKVASKGNSSTGRVYFEHFMGTPNYMAPECIHNRFSDKPCDIYSLGCLFYIILCGFPPFVGGSDYLIFQEALEKRIHMYPSVFELEEQQLIQKMLDHDANNRPTVEQIIEELDVMVAFQTFLRNSSKEYQKQLEDIIVMSKIPEKMNGEEIDKFLEVQKDKLMANHLQIVGCERIEERVSLLRKQIRHFHDVERFVHGV